MNSQLTKICRGCLVEKALEDFPLHGTTPTLRRALCKPCYLQSRRESWRKHDAKRNEKRRDKWKNDVEYRNRNRLASARYREKKKEQLVYKTKIRYQERRDRILMKYGNRCECCNESRREFLAMDHVYGGGMKERKTIGPTGIWKKLDKNDRLPEYRILCHDCNMALGFYGYYPHDSEDGISDGILFCS